MKRILGLLGLALLLAACNQGSSSTSQVKLLLTDAPADEATELMVNFGKIQLVPSDDSESGIVTLSEDGGSIDILTLRNGVTDVLADKSVPDGTYHQLRLIISDATITIDGTDHPVTIPSGTQTGLKINIDPPLQAASGQSSVITMDFDARRVIQTGNGQYKLGPTAIRATSISGTLQGTIVDAEGTPLESAIISISNSQGEVTSSLSSNDGSFKIITLLEGSYTVTVSLEGYETQTFNAVSISANQNTQLTTDGKISLVPIAV